MNQHQIGMHNKIRRRARELAKLQEEADYYGQSAPQELLRKIRKAKKRLKWAKQEAGES